MSKVKIRGRSEVLSMILIPAGPFRVGSSLENRLARFNETPCHKVELPDFYIGRYPVTNAEYAQFVQELDHPVPGHWQNQVGPETIGDHPVTNVSFKDALAYCDWLSQKTGHPCRLPTEAEWEKAARGPYPDARVYVWGEVWEPNRCNSEELGRGTTTPVHAFQVNNESPYGVTDMLGNVWEWTDSWYERYPNNVVPGKNYGRNYRVVRGGSWQTSPKSVRVSCRGRYKPGAKRPTIGFRLATDWLAGTDSPDIDQVKLADDLGKYFNLTELEDLCFRLDISHENFTSHLSTMPRELVQYCWRHGHLGELVALCRQLRPKVEWL